MPQPEDYSFKFRIEFLWELIGQNQTKNRWQSVQDGGQPTLIINLSAPNRYCALYYSVLPLT
jgi:hypothetical protein